ncbi:MAG TPA: GNAT family N-acetyltransferase, partial [Prosthecobacter sp.]|nr:GNAT family N-acetyltransferase [Prosthecobacter sp.]
DTHPPLIETLQAKLVGCRIREFHPNDLEACLDIHRSNEPDLLDPAGFEAFLEFLAHGTSYILVIEHEGRVVACAGLELMGETNAARLLHAMVHRNFQHRGLGTTLLAARLSLLEPEDGQPVHVLLRARPEAGSFYGAYGFVLHSLEQDQGRALLRLTLAQEDIEAIRAQLSQHGVEIVLNELNESGFDETAESE